jgi:hypothetical protein
LQAKQNDTGKALLLFVAIACVLGFVVWTAVNASGRKKPPRATASQPLAASTPETDRGTSPDVLVVGAEPQEGELPRTVNPFRKTVSTEPVTAPAETPYGRRQPNSEISGGSLGVAGGSGTLEPVRPTVPDDMEFRLDGVLVNESSVAVVSRAGKTVLLRVGSPAAYGYKIASIRPTGVRLTGKRGARWLWVGERLDPPSLSGSSIGD